MNTYFEKSITQKPTLGQHLPFSFSASGQASYSKKWVPYSSSIDGRMGRISFFVWVAYSSLLFALAVLTLMRYSSGDEFALLVMTASVYVFFVYILGCKEIWGILFAYAVLISGYLIQNSANFLAFIIVVPLFMIYCIAYIVFQIKAITRRLHDFNFSGWWMLLYFVSNISFLFLLILFLMPGTPGDNKYAPPPEKNSIVTILAMVIIIVLTPLWVSLVQ